MQAGSRLAMEHMASLGVVGLAPEQRLQMQPAEQRATRDTLAIQVTADSLFQRAVETSDEGQLRALMESPIGGVEFHHRYTHRVSSRVSMAVG